MKLPRNIWKNNLLYYKYAQICISSQHQHYNVGVNSTNKYGDTGRNLP
jgi:hypothetical protein